jgi:dihydrodipicolinate synthase/N-acetylneuraminate lyase
MRPLTAAELGGTWGTVLLPIGEHDRIDWARLAEDVDHLAASGLHGLYAHGTAGEFYALDEQEHERVSELLARRCEADGIPFQLGASHMSGRIGLDRIRRVRGLAPGAIQVTLPDWLPLGDDEVVGALDRMVDAADPIPLVLYNPPAAKTQVGPELYGRLAAEVPSVIGIKVLGGDAEWFEAMRAAAPRLRVFVAGSRLATGVRMGAAGSYSNVACLSPSGARRWWDAMHAHPDAAADVERRIGEFLARAVAPLQREGYADPALDKFLAHTGGWSRAGTRTRWPHRWIPEARAEAARPLARRLVPELFEPRAAMSPGVKEKQAG